jgi:hypothetical protein
MVRKGTGPSANFGTSNDPLVGNKIGGVKTLEKRCKKIVLYANKMIAHRTEEQRDLTLAEIHGAMDFIEDMFKKYYVILTGRSLMQAEPAVQFDWMEPFTIPWIRPRAVRFAECGFRERQAINASNI